MDLQLWNCEYRKILFGVWSKAPGSRVDLQLRHCEYRQILFRMRQAEKLTGSNSRTAIYRAGN